MKIISIILLVACFSLYYLHAMQQAIVNPPFSDHHKTQIISLLKKSQDPATAVEKINAFVAKDPTWQTFMVDKTFAGSVIDTIDNYRDDSDDERDMIAVALEGAGTIEWLKEYLPQHPKAEKSLQLLLIDCCRWSEPNPFPIAKKLLTVGITPNSKDRGNIVKDNPGAAALVTAVTYDKKDIIQLFLDHNVDIEIKDPWDGRTALMQAALDGNHEILQELIKRGANINAQNGSGTTALIWAASYARIEAVKLLLAAGADVTIKNEDHETALSEAKRARRSQYEERYQTIIELLQQAGAKE